MKTAKLFFAATIGLFSASVVSAGIALADTASDNAAAANAVTALGGMSFMFICCYALVILGSIALAIFSLIMFYDAAMREKAQYPNDNKSMWILLFIFLSYWAAIFYYFMVKRKVPRV